MRALELFAVLLVGYLLGALPIGLFASRWLAGVDPRKAGSRNIGFTNVLRVAGNAAGSVTLVGDMGKGALAVLFARLLLGSTAGDWPLAAGGAAILGHIYPLYLKFKGGKGVATSLGVFLAVDLILGGSLLAIWLFSAALWRTSSLAAMIAFASLPVLTWIRHPQPIPLAFALAVSGLIAYRHLNNIRRLLAGTEPKLGVRRNVG